MRNDHPSRWSQHADHARLHREEADHHRDVRVRAMWIDVRLPRQADRDGTDRCWPAPDLTQGKSAFPSGDRPGCPAGSWGAQPADHLGAQLRAGVELAGLRA